MKRTVPNRQRILTLQSEPLYPRFVDGEGCKDYLALGLRPPEDWHETASILYIDTTPRFVRQHLQNTGWQAFMPLWPTDVALPAHYAEHLTHPSHDRRSHPEQIGGCCFAHEKIIYSSLARARPDDKIETRRPEHIAAVMRHETAHAVRFAFAATFTDTVFAEALRRDVTKLGGYEAMRANKAGYFTPDNHLPDRDIDEIWAECMSALWGGGCLEASAAFKAYPTCIAACLHFLNYMENSTTEELLDQQNPRLLTMITQLNEPAENRLGDCLELYETTNCAFAPRRPSRLEAKTSPSVRRKTAHLMQDIAACGHSLCNWGIPLRDIYLSPTNVAAVLLRDLARRSLSAPSDTAIHTLWNQCLDEYPLETAEGQKLLRRYGPRILHIQSLVVPGNELNRFVSSVIDLQSPLWMHINPQMTRQIADGFEQIITPDASTSSKSTHASPENRPRLRAKPGFDSKFTKI